MSVLDSNLQKWNQIYTEDMLTADFIAEQQVSSRWQSVEAKDGNRIDVTCIGDREITLQSKYRPLEEAGRYVRQFEGVKPGSCFLMLGMGNGYILRELMQYMQAVFVIYEPDMSYFCHVMHEYDLSDIIACEHIKLYISGINANQLELHMYAYVNETNWHLFYMDFLPKYQQLYPEAVVYLQNLYEDSRIHGYQNYDNTGTFAKRHMMNLLHNLRYLYTGSSIMQYQNILQDIPVIIVAAGPSLEKNVELLKRYRDRAFIICVDHAIPMLSQHGIVPHMYMTVDAAKNPDMFVTAKDAPWLVYTTSNPEALAVLQNPKCIFVSTLCDYIDWLYQKAGSGLRQMESGGSVATNAVQAAIGMGSRQIILIGQDLALTGNRLYAGIEATDLKEGHDILSVKAFDGGQVQTRTDYKTYIDYYRALTAQRKDVTFVNATEGGAYIDGMLHMTLDDAMHRYGLTEPFDGDRLLWHVPNLMTPDTQRIFLTEYHALMSYFKNVKREVKTAVTWVERGVQILEKNGYQAVELNKVEAVMDHFQNIYNGHPGKSILDMGVGREMQEALLDISFTKENLTQELMRLYQKMLTFYQGVESCVTEAIPILQEVLDTLEAG